MTKLNFSKEEFNKKKRQALLKLNSFREKFEKQKEERESDLDEASKTLAELSKKFNPFDSLRSLRVDTERSRSIKWWQSLP